jgi:HlyD family secretion protein
VPPEVHAVIYVLGVPTHVVADGEAPVLQCMKAEFFGVLNSRPMFGFRRLFYASFSAAAIMTGLGACQSSSGSLPAPKVVSERPFVAALGKLEPSNRVIDIGVSGDGRVSRILVTEGQSVNAGDILAYLESHSRLAAVRDHASATLRDAEARLNADVEQAQARIQEARLHLRQLTDVPVLEIQAQRAKIRQIQSDLDLAVRERDRKRALMEQSVIPSEELDRQSSQADSLRAALEFEEATLQRTIKSAETDREIAEAQVSTRIRELESIRSAAQIASLARAVEVAEADLNESVIRSPSAGRIIEIVANPGQSVVGKVLLRMGDVSQMYVLAEVYETDIARVKIGQAVEISSGALSKTFNGKVERIGTSVFKREVRDIDPQADVDARIVQVRVRLDESEEAARFVGLQVNARIYTDK